MNSEEFTLAIGKILKFELPPTMKRGKEQKIHIKVHGKGNNIFWTLLLIDPLKGEQWWPDNSSIDLVKNGGKINLHDEDFESSWYIPIFGDAVLGEYIAFLGMYQDTYDLPTVNRRLLDYKVRKVRVTINERKRSKSMEVNVAGTKSEKEYFEILRNRIIWCICHNLISKNIRKFHGVDMVTECAGAFVDDASISKYKSTGEHEYYKPTLQKIYRPLVEGGFIKELENNNFSIPKGSKLEKICRTQLRDGRAYMNWNEIDWG